MDIPTSFNECSMVTYYFFFFESLSLIPRLETDIKFSKDLTDSFKECMDQLENHDDMDITFSIMVLGTNFWPLKPPSHDLVIPLEILPTYDRFQKYYKIKHPGRKLIWVWNFSKNELRTNYLNQKYLFITSSYEMAVLLQYNQNDKMSLDEFVAATSISKDILSQVLAALVKKKILIYDGKKNYDLNPSKKYFISSFIYQKTHLFVAWVRLQIKEFASQIELANHQR